MKCDLLYQQTSPFPPGWISVSQKLLVRNSLREEVGRVKGRQPLAGISRNTDTKGTQAAPCSGTWCPLLSLTSTPLSWGSPGPILWLETAFC